MKKVLVAMSGGVDSSVAALLLKEQGYDCLGVSMLLTGEAHQGPAQAFDRADRMCQQLGIPHQTVDFRQEFDRRVIQPFVAAYERGETPNPCVICNRTVKFGLLWELAQAQGCDWIATGHYCRTCQREGRWSLEKAADGAKDQTYFLHALSQEILPHILFPLGNLTKPEVRQLAQAAGLEAASSPDSQDICFVPAEGYLAFLEGYRGTPYPPADLVDQTGQTLGHGKSALAYTVGQRKGLGLARPEPTYVLSTDVAGGQVVVGSEEALYRTELQAKDWNWMGASGTKGLKAGVKVRYNAREIPAWIEPAPPQEGTGADGTGTDGTAGTRTEGVGAASAGAAAPVSDRVTIRFDQPVRAIAPGQSAVAYKDGYMVGGGIII